MTNYGDKHEGKSNVCAESYQGINKFCMFSDSARA